MLLRKILKSMDNKCNDKSTIALTRMTLKERICRCSITHLSRRQRSSCSNIQKPAWLSKVRASFHTHLQLYLSSSLSLILSLSLHLCSRGPLRSSRRLITSRALPSFCFHCSSNPPPLYLFLPPSHLTSDITENALGLKGFITNSRVSLL